MPISLMLIIARNPVRANLCVRPDYEGRTHRFAPTMLMVNRKCALPKR
jgi:hypothetical protein